MIRKTRGTIKDLPKILRPREKMIKDGPNKLFDAELLAILLRTGKKGENVVRMAGRLLRKFGHEKIVEVSFDELKKFSGLGPAKACEIMACFELGKRFLKKKKSVLVISPKEIWQEMKDLRCEKKEHFVVFYLDIRNQVIKKEIISIGTLTANLVHPREVFEPAVLHLAAQVVLAHNHPSGEVNPSDEDLEMTGRLVKAGEILGIEVIDHVIVCKNSFLSFKKEGLL